MNGFQPESYDDTHVNKESEADYGLLDLTVHIPGEKRRMKIEDMEARLRD